MILKKIVFLNRFLKFVAFIILVISLLYLVNNFTAQKNNLVNLDVKFQLSFVSMASILFLLTHFIYILLWKKILKLLGDNISFSGAASAYFYTLPFKYVPGKIWLPMSRIGYLHNNHYDKRNVAASLILDASFKFFSGCIIASSCYFIFSKWNIRDSSLLNISTTIVIIFTLALLIGYLGMFLYNKKIGFIDIILKSHNRIFFAPRIFFLLWLYIL